MKQNGAGTGLIWLAEDKDKWWTLMNEGKFLNI
jgi:hypothetical protein